MSITLITPPATEPVTLANARGAIGITDAADTSSLDASEAYTWQLKRTGSGTVKTCGKGTFTLDLDDA